ncbi:MAG: HAMP domain-containing histidine kinase [Bacteroidales bacterium]|jgi:two-component system phosphate regulon sensor histidine kinase PhoR|nr:HAMP domain-containing histidine kinase [Bacteroidales bacterium]
MKKRLIQFILIITTLSLMGIVLTQVLWVKRAIDLRTNEFNLMVQSKLSKIEKQLYDYREKYIRIEHGSICDAKNDSVLVNHWFHDGICTVLDTMMDNEFGHFKPKIEYDYALLDTVNDDLLCGNYTIEDISQISDSWHKISLSRLNDRNNYVVTIHFENEKHIILRKMFLWLIILSGIFLLIVVSSFTYVILSLLKQKKVSEMKNDFINNMTHELKTPISTISVASEMLMKPQVSENCEKTRKYANIIYDENMRLRNQVEQVLQMSVLDHNKLKLNPVMINVHKLIENSVDIFNMMVKEKGGLITTDLKATQTVIKADELHFINVFTNMLDNAVKYSIGAPAVKITTANRDQGISILIEDNGMGISAANQKNIFKKFYRVHTGDIHNVKGFGLGLYYVKSVMDAHGGAVNLVRSELNKGTVFELFFPLNFNKINDDEHTNK